MAATWMTNFWRPGTIDRDKRLAVLAVATDDHDTVCVVDQQEWVHSIAATHSANLFRGRLIKQGLLDAR